MKTTTNILVKLFWHYCTKLAQVGLRDYAGLSLFRPKHSFLIETNGEAHHCGHVQARTNTKVKEKDLKPKKLRLFNGLAFLTACCTAAKGDQLSKVTLEATAGR